MAITASIQPASSSSPSYPYLAKLRNPLEDKTFVVLFTGYRAGFVVQRNVGAEQPLGHYSAEWYMPTFEPLKGELILRNA